MRTLKFATVRVLGIDPGSQRTGFGVVDATGPRLTYVASGVIRTEQGEFSARLCEIFRCVRSVVAQYRPQEIAIERVFVNRNPDSALKLGQARGAAICGTVDANAEVFEYATRQIKQAVVGSGSAEKAQVQLMMRSILKLEGPRDRRCGRCVGGGRLPCAARPGACVAQIGGEPTMIGFLKGRLAAKQPPTLLIDVNGVGYELEAPMSTFYGLPATGEPVALFTHLVIREDAHILFGFGTDSERRLFRGLLKVSGVGPKIALGILSGASVDDFMRIIEAEDLAMLTRIPGIGRKTAERVIIEMRDSVQKFAVPAAGQAGALGAGAALTPQSEAFSALIALGYKPPEVTRLLKAADEPGLSTTEIIRRALKSAAKA